MFLLLLLLTGSPSWHLQEQQWSSFSCFRGRALPAPASAYVFGKVSGQLVREESEVAIL